MSKQSEALRLAEKMEIYKLGITDRLASGGNVMGGAA